MKRIVTATLILVLCSMASAMDLSLGGSWSDVKSDNSAWGGELAGRIPLDESLLGTLSIGYRDLGAIDDIALGAGLLTPIPLGEGLRLTAGAVAQYHFLRTDAQVTDSVNYSFSYHKCHKTYEWEYSYSHTEGLDIRDTWTSGPVANVEWELAKGLSAFLGGAYQWDLHRQDAVDLTGWTVQSGFLIQLP